MNRSRNLIGCWFSPTVDALLVPLPNALRRLLAASILVMGIAATVNAVPVLTNVYQYEGTGLAGHFLSHLLIR